MARVKRVIPVVAAIALVAAACGGDKKNEATPSASVESSPVLQSSGDGPAPGTLNPSASPAATTGTQSSGTPPAATTPAAGQTGVAVPTIPQPGSTLPVQSGQTQPAGSTPVGSAGTATIRATAGQVSNGTVEVILSANGEGGAQLGGWAVDISFDTSRLAVDTCTAGNDGVCNPRFRENAARIVGVTLEPKNGEIGRIRFKVTGSGGTPVQVQANQCLTPQGQPLTCTGMTVSIGQ